MINVLFVCLGNICRSPLAEGVFLKQVAQRGLSEYIKADSAGTASYHIGSLADERSRKVALAKGIELSHRARAFSADDFHAFDYIIPMDVSNLSNVKRLMPDEPKSFITLMRDFDTIGKGKEVPDPYYGNIQDFEEVYHILHRCCNYFLDHIVSKHRLSVQQGAS